MKTLLTAALVCTVLGTVVLVCAVFPSESLATEGGTGHYLPGSLATLIDLPPTKPGWVIETVYLHYNGDTSTSQRIPIAGTVAFDLDATSNAVLVGGLYTFKQPVLGAMYSIGAYLPYVWIDVEGKIETQLGTKRVRDSESGIGDATLLPAMLAWKFGDWQFNTLLSVYAPTGKYKKGRLANPGLNYWSFDPIFGVAYNNTKIGFNTALHGGITFNTENPDTDYRSGSMFHLDGSIQQLLPIGPGFLSVGAEAFYLDQITDDSSDSRFLGDFKGHTTGVGPVMGYVLPRGEETLVVELRWLPELDVKNRFKGDYVWVKVIYQF